MEFNQLRYFVATAEAGSISRAAKRCRIAQPSLSQQIKRLEQGLGVELFDRLGRGIALTDAGRSLLPRARKILADIREARSILSDEDGFENARLTIGAIPTMAPYVLPQLVASLKRQYPDSEFHIREDLTENLSEALIDNEIDVAIVSTPLDHELIDLEVIGSEAMVVVVPATHPLCSARSVGIDDLRDEPAVALHEMHCLGQQITAFCTHQRINRPIVCRTTQLATVLELVRKKLGISVIPQMAARYDSGRDLVFLPIARGNPKRDIAIAWRHGRTRPRLGEHVRSLITEQLLAD